MPAKARADDGKEGLYFRLDVGWVRKFDALCRAHEVARREMLERLISEEELRRSRLRRRV